MNAPELEALLVEGLYAHRDAQTAQRVADKGTEDRTNPYITELGKPCDRAVWRNLHDEHGEDFEPAALMTFAAGHAFEEIIADSLKAQRVEFLREIRIEIPADGTMISGRLDYLLSADGHLCELKSIGAQALDMMIRKKESGKSDHVSQLNGYLHATQLGALKYKGWLPHPTLPAGSVLPEGYGAVEMTLSPQHKGFLVYGNVKPDWKAERSYEKPIHVIEVDYDMLRARREIQRLGELWAQLTEPDIPAGYSPTRFPCGSQRKDGTIKSWCAHHERCWG